MTTGYPDNVHINPERFVRDFEQLSQIGATPAGGVNRPALSPTHLEARRWMKERAEQAGLSVRQDTAGNQIIFLESSSKPARTLIIGSHLDSVPYGGRFDGALGVLAGLEVLRVLKERGIDLPFNLETIDFTDEEGTLVSFLGSFAMSGKLTETDLLQPRGGLDALQQGLQRAALVKNQILNAHRDPKELAGYLELHIEQGPKLEEAGMPIGIVDAITGIKFFFLIFRGRADHAGTTPMNRRRDAGLAASTFVTKFHRLIRQRYSSCLGNVGKMEFSPGAFNIVPAEVRLMVEIRAGRKEELAELADSAVNLGKDTARQFGVVCHFEPVGERLPAQMDTGLQLLIRQVAEENGWNTLSLSSGAGHDAQSFADLCPTAVMFIPSRGGISHAEDEFSTMEDCLRGAELLLQVVLRFRV